MSRQICLVASGDSRLPANRVCWPAQEALEAAVARAFADARLHHRPRPSVRPGGAARVPRQPDPRHRGVPGHRSVGAAGRRRGGVAVHEPRAARADEAPRPDPHAGQLERAVAGPRGPAQPERLAHQGRRPVQLDLERDVRGRLRAPGRWRSGWPTAASITTRATPGRSRSGRLATNCAARPLHGAALGRAVAVAPGDHGHLRRGLHGDVQRDHPRPPAARDGHLQGAAQPVGALRRDAGGERRDGRAPPTRGCVSAA